MGSIKTSHLVMALLLVFISGWQVNSAVKDAIWRMDTTPAIRMAFKFLSPLAMLFVAGTLLFRHRRPPQ